MKQADSSLLFPLLMKVLEICVSPRVYTIHKLSLLKKSAYMAIYHRIDQYISFLGKVRIKTHRFLYYFWTFLLGKLINSVDPQGNTSGHQGLRQQQRK